MMDFLLLVAYVIGFGFLSYLFLSALTFSFSNFRKSENILNNDTKKTAYSSHSTSTPNMLISLDKQLKDIDLLFFLMLRRQPRSRLVPYTSLCRSLELN